jgi:TonB family protein
MIWFAAALAMLQPVVLPPPPPPPMPQAGAQRPHATVPLPNLFSWEDYPVDAVHRGSEGTVGFRLGIDAAGRVTDCAVLASTSDADLDRATCAILMARARYTPAHDADGRAVADTDFGRVTWQLPPEDEGDSFTPGRYMNRLDADAAGAIRCTVSIDAAPGQAGQESTCEQFAETGTAESLRLLHAEASLTIIFAVTPEGETPLAGDESGLGERLSEMESRITIAADGRVTDCRPLRSETSPRVERLMILAGLCDSPYDGTSNDHIFMADAGRPIRHARLRQALYLRRGVGPASR